MYSEDLISDILAKSDIVEVVSAYIEVKKKGKNYVAICPFHNDTNPSLSISKDKQIFKCFVCGTGGNAFTFVQKYEHCDFITAVRKVAEICGIKDPRLDENMPKKRVDETKEPLYKCINDLQQFYKYSLSIEEASKAREYLKNRNISVEQIQKYGIGYSPLDGEKTISYLQAKKHSLKTIEDIGICYIGANKILDTNFGRIIFPLCDSQGQVVGFSARQIEKDGTEKYRNSPETPIFIKGNILYNYHNAKNSAHHDGYCYLLEGFMDVMALDKAGIKSAVAIMGTALTNNQIDLLRKLRCEIRLCLDGDEAGQKGMMKIIGQFQQAKIPFRIVDYQDDLRDPDDILQQEGAEALVKKMNNLFDALPFQLHFYQKIYRVETLDQRKAILNNFIPKLVALGPGLEQEDYIYKLADATGFHDKAIREMIKEYKFEETALNEETVDISNKKNDLLFASENLNRLLNAEKTILYYMLSEKGAVEFYEKNIKSFYNSSFDEIANYIIDYKNNHDEIELNGILLEIDQSESESGERLKGIITEIAMSDNFVPFKEETIKACGEIIVEEKERLRYKQSIEKKSDEKDTSAASLAEYAKKRREKLSKK
ncbi:MAG: DNA primase [Bacilli bacterium]|nr:DNA primase [Bacilli bacterium]MDY6430682.1 DNA primase [Bacilli bacterium]